MQSLKYHLSSLQNGNETTYITIASSLGILSLTWFLLKSLRNRKESSSITQTTVSELNVYPVKSCQEISLKEAQTSPLGFRFDRIVQVTDEFTGATCTPRLKEYEKLFHIRPEIIDDNILRLHAPPSSSLQLSPLHIDINLNSVDYDDIQVNVMKTQNISLKDYGTGKWLDKAASIQNCRLTGIGKHQNYKYNRIVKMNINQGEELPPSPSPFPVNLADEAPYLLTSEESLHDLNQKLKENNQKQVDMRRFRPNIVISSGCNSRERSYVHKNNKVLKPWEEDTWKKIQIAGVQFYVWQRCGRCTMTTIDRDTLQRGPEPLRELSSFRERENGQRNFGVHLIEVPNQAQQVDTKEYESKTIRVGDQIIVLEYDEERRREWVKLHS